jgi:hypothetical protein
MLPPKLKETFTRRRCTFASVLIFALGMVWALAGSARCQTFKPSGTIEIDSGSLLKELGFQLIEATVRLRGKLYRVRFYGISAGPRGYHALGNIYGLDDIDDIVGRYDRAGSGAALVSATGVEIVVNPPVRPAPGYIYIDYLGSLYARHDESAQFGPRD